MWFYAYAIISRSLQLFLFCLKLNASYSPLTRQV